MQLTSHIHLRPDRPSRRSARLRRRDVAEVRRAKRAGGPQDRALYTCACGCAFTAAVSTSVGCPHCGSAQAW